MHRSRHLGHWALISLLLAGCDSCDKKRDKPKASQPLEQQECESAADCVVESSCILAECQAGRCRAAFVEKGARCDNETVCDGIERCDGLGRCQTGPPPSVDDGDPCTKDSCDAVQGALHEPVVVDDGDRCTEDACNPETGEITHAPVDIDDGDDCTFDSCDPISGPKHRRPDPFYTCKSSCGDGFHVASRSPSAQCGRALRSFCAPSCGDSLYTCDSKCPRGYHSSTRSPSQQCGPGAESTFCQKTSGPSLYTCDATCPEGYAKQSERPSRQCGRDTPTQVFCMQR